MPKLKKISVVIHNLVLILRDGFVWLANDRASSTRCVLAPEAFGKGGSVLLAKLAPFGEGAPGIVIRKRNPLRLGRTVRSGTRLRKILLVILLGKIPKSSIFVVVSRRGNFSSDFSLRSSIFLQCLFICLLGSLNQLFLFIVEIVKAFVIVESSSCSKEQRNHHSVRCDHNLNETSNSKRREHVKLTRSILGSTIISLSHTASGVMGFPKPTKDVCKGNFGGIVDDTNSFSMAGQSTACLLISRVGSKSGTIS